MKTLKLIARILTAMIFPVFLMALILLWMMVELPALTYYAILAAFSRKYKDEYDYAELADDTYKALRLW